MNQLIISLIVITVATTANGYFQANSGSCREARLCCPGRDPSCAVHKVLPKASKLSSKYFSDDSSDDDDIDNNDVGNNDDRTCYCDHACTTVGDCCHDYESTCGVSDCEVSDWGIWSECDVPCGLGTMTRQRKVLREARNGGKSCPELMQKRGCNGLNCLTESRMAMSTSTALKASRESALILPSSYSNLRKVNETLDIRKNLRLQYPRDLAKEKSRQYCVVFEVSKSRKGCEVSENESIKSLIPGKRVCVSCESAAMRKHLGYRCHGHGIDEKSTRWTSVSSDNCHGRWIRRGGQYDTCPCHSDGLPDFIFV